MSTSNPQYISPVVNRPPRSKLKFDSWFTSVIKTIMPASDSSAPGKAMTWMYTTAQPASDWYAPGFDDASWQQGKAGFGNDRAPKATVRTAWHTSDIWLRRTFRASQEDLGDLYLKIYHDDNATVYLNGTKVAELGPRSGRYKLIPLGAKVLEQTRVRNDEFDADLVYVTDPDGTRIECVETPNDPTRPEAS